MGDDKAQSSETATDTFLWLRQVAQDFMNLDPVACSIAVNQSHYFSGGRLEFFLVKDKAAAELKVHPKTIQRGIRSLVENGHMIEFGRHKRHVVYHATMKEPATESPVVGQRVSNYGGGVVGQRMSNYRSDRAAPTARSRTHAVQGSLDRSSPYLDTRCPRDSLENLPGSDSTEAPPPPSPPAVEAQRAADEERKRIDLTATPRDEGLARALAGFAACKPSGRTIAADEVAAVITDKPIPTAAIDVTPREAPMLTPVAAEWDACLQLVAEWGGINLDRAVETVTAMVAKLPIERVQHHFSKVAKLHRSGGNKLDLVERAIAKELADLHPAQGDLFARSPDVMALGATSPPAGAAPPPQAFVFDLAALREYASQIAAWRPDLDAATAQRVAREWMTAAGVKRLGQLFAKVGPRKRSGAFKFRLIEDLVANPRPLRPARRQA